MKRAREARHCKPAARIIDSHIDFNFEDENHDRVHGGCVLCQWPKTGERNYGFTSVLIGQPDSSKFDVMPLSGVAFPTQCDIVCVMPTALVVVVRYSTI